MKERIIVREYILERIAEPTLTLEDYLNEVNWAIEDFWNRHSLGRYSFTFVIDKSASMSEPVNTFFSKLDIVKNLLAFLLKGLISEKFGITLIFFNENTEIYPIGFMKKNKLNEVLKIIDKQIPSGWTALYDTLVLATLFNVQEIRNDVEKHILVLTDGLENRSKNFPKVKEQDVLNIILANFRQYNPDGIDYFHAWLVGREVEKDIFFKLKQFSEDRVFIVNIPEQDFVEKLALHFIYEFYAPLGRLLQTLKYEIFNAMDRNDIEAFKKLHLIGAKILWILALQPEENKGVPLSLFDLIFNEFKLDKDFYAKFVINLSNWGLIEVNPNTNMIFFKIDEFKLRKFLSL